jgi:molybdopterin-containing oxidoreductase family iron-sulfur binding subunit
MEACKVENNTPEGTFWMYVFRLEDGEYPNTRTYFLPRPCQHCDNPPCAKVCPVGARYKREDGLVATDWQRCIGCRYCEVACPYGVNFFNWKSPKKRYYLNWQDKDLLPVLNGVTPGYQNPDLEKRYGSEQRRIAGGGHAKGVIEKCTFCVQRLEQDLQPACTANCPVSVLNFGDLDDPNSKVSQLLKQRPHFRLLEEAGTHPRVYYLGEKPPGPETRQIEAVKGKV